MSYYDIYILSHEIAKFNRHFDTPSTHVSIIAPLVCSFFEICVLYILSKNLNEL